MIDMFGYEAPEVNTDPNAIGEEYFQAVILEPTYPLKYTKRLQEEAKITGMASVPSYKEGGLSLKCAVIYRSRSMDNKECGEKVFVTDGNGKLVHPGSIVTFNLTAYPPPMVFDERKFGEVTGYSELLKHDMPVEVNIMPPTESVKWDDTTKKMIKFHDCAPSHPFYEELKIVEEGRLKAWNKVLTNWDQKSEQEAFNTLLTFLCYKYLLCNRNEGTNMLTFARATKKEGEEVILARPGLTFTAFNTSTNKWINPGVFKKSKKDANGRYSNPICYSALSISFQSKEYVNALKECIAEYDAKRNAEWEAKQAAKLQPITEEEYIAINGTPEEINSEENSPW